VQGHELRLPNGDRFRVDKVALVELQKSGFLTKHRTTLRNTIFDALRVPGLLTDRLRRHLGVNCTERYSW